MKATDWKNILKYILHSTNDKEYVLHFKNKKEIEDKLAEFPWADIMKKAKENMTVEIDHSEAHNKPKTTENTS